jgi:hypothetical protein
MDYGKDSYTTAAAVQTYLDRTLTSNELLILAYVILAASRWIDRTLGTCFDNLNQAAFGQPGSGASQKRFAGGFREINIKPCQQITAVQAINPYDFSVWYTYTQPLEYTQEPYDQPVKRSLRMKLNEFTGDNLKWPGEPGEVDTIQVTGLFTEYDYVNNCYPNDIVLLCNHIAAVFMQNNQNAEPVQREAVEGHLVIKRIDDLLLSDPMVNRVLQSREEVWLEEM